MKGCATSTVGKMFGAINGLRKAAATIVTESYPHENTRLKDRCDHCDDPWPCAYWRLVEALKRIDALLGSLKEEPK